MKANEPRHKEVMLLQFIYRLDLAQQSLPVLPSHCEVVVLPLHQSLVLSPHEVHPRLVGPPL